MPRLRRALVGALLLLVLLLLTGSLSWVSARGTSMGSAVPTGSLVLLARTGAYDVGDVVAHQDPVLAAVVLHRVVRVEDGRLVLRGDAQGWEDAARPRPEEVLGEQALVVPVPAQRAALVLAGGAAAALLLRRLLQRRARLSGRQERAVAGGRMAARGRLLPELPRLRLPLLELSERSEAVAGATAGTTALLLALTLAGPLVRPAEPPLLTTTVSWAYGATARAGAAYPDGRVGTGQTVYLALVRDVELSADLALEAPGRAEVSGTWTLQVQLSDDRGFARTVLESPTVPVSQSRLALTVRPTEQLALAQAVADETGSPLGDLRLTATAQLSLDADGSPVRDQAAYLLRLEPLALRPVAADQPAAQTQGHPLPSRAGSRVVLLGQALSPSAVRWPTGALLVGSLVVLVWARRSRSSVPPAVPREPGTGQSSPTAVRRSGAGRSRGALALDGRPAGSVAPAPSTRPPAARLPAARLPGSGLPGRRVPAPGTRGPGARGPAPGAQGPVPLPGPAPARRPRTPAGTGGRTGPATGGTVQPGAAAPARRTAPAVPVVAVPRPRAPGEGRR